MNYPFSIAEVLQSLWITSPLLALIAAALAILVVDALAADLDRWTLPMLGVVGVAVAFALLRRIGCDGQNGHVEVFFGMMQSDYLVYLAQQVILAVGIFLLLVSPQHIEGRAIPRGEYYALLVFAIMGMMALAASCELLTLFLNLELLSITLYVLAGIEKRNMRSTEAAFKYFLLGSFAAAFLLLGIAFVFGATGQTRFAGISIVLHRDGFNQTTLLMLGLCLMMVGFGFKLTLAPFHMYAPDVYEGAPTPIAAAIATGSKVAGFTALFSLIAAVARGSQTSFAPGAPPVAPLPGMHGLWLTLYAIAVASMIVGNVGAVVQPNLKRMLAYSSIAHSGYMLVPLVAVVMHPELLSAARDALAYYLLAYALMTLLAFGVASTLGPRGEGRISLYAGLYARSPFLALVMALAMVSLIGIPPTLGFFGKWQLFLVAVRGGEPALAVIAFLASVASAFYYLRITVVMFMQEPEPGEEAAAPVFAGANRLALGASAIGLLLFAICPWLYLFAS